MERVRRGDATAFEEVFHRHEGRVYGYILRRSHDETLAADLTQEAFIRLWRRRANWTAGGSVAGYLIRTAHSLTIDEHRRTEVRERWSNEASGVPHPSVPSPDVELERRELAARIAAAVDALPDRTREVFSLKRDAGLSYREIGELLGISTKTVDAHMNKALRFLRNELSDLR